MSFTHKEPLRPKLTALPASNDIELLVRAEHPDPFSILGPHDDEQGGQFIRAFLPEALSVQVLARDNGEPLGSLDATQVPGLFVGHFAKPNSAFQSQEAATCPTWSGDMCSDSAPHAPSRVPRVPILE